MVFRGAWMFLFFTTTGRSGISMTSLAAGPTESISLPSLVVIAWVRSGERTSNVSSTGSWLPFIVTLFFSVHSNATTNQTISTGAHPDLYFPAPVTAAFPGPSSPRLFFTPWSELPVGVVAGIDGIVLGLVVDRPGTSRQKPSHGSSSG